MTTLLVWICLFLASTSAYAGDWAETFSEDSLPDHLLESKVVIATGGPGSTAAGETLVDTLRGAGSPAAMMNPVFDDIDGISDNDVVADLDHLPVDLVVLIRTFGEETVPETPENLESDESDNGDENEPDRSAQPGTPDMGMLTIYSIEGQAIAGFMIYPGQSLTRDQRRQVGRGISQKTVDAAAEAIKARSEPNERYDLRTDEIELRIYDRQEHRSITGVELYETLGYSDLVDAYEENKQRRKLSSASGVVLLTLGSLTITGGLTYWLAQYVREPPSDDTSLEACLNTSIPASDCRREARERHYDSQMRSGQIISIVGAAAFLIGAISAFQGWRMEVHPDHDYDFQKRVDEVNARERNSDDDGEEYEDQGQSLNEPTTTDIAFGVTPYYLGTGQESQVGLSLQINW